MVLPGMFSGQSIIYILARFTKRLLGIDLRRKRVWHYADILIPTILMIFTRIFNVTEFVALIMGMNLCYTVCVIGDHDTVETVSNEIDSKNPEDWGEVQVRGSGNFVNGVYGDIFSRIHGGINYQIEHHLFPNVCHEHYPAIAPIVLRTCAEFGIPYVHHDSLWAVFKSFHRQTRMSAAGVRKTISCRSGEEFLDDLKNEKTEPLEPRVF